MWAVSFVFLSFAACFKYTAGASCRLASFTSGFCVVQTTPADEVDDFHSTWHPGNAASLAGGFCHPGLDGRLLQQPPRLSEGRREADRLSGRHQHLWVWGTKTVAKPFFLWMGDDITTATPQLVDFFGGCTDSCLSVYATEKLRKKNQTVLSTRRINDSVAQTIGGAKNNMCTERSVIYRCNRWSGKVFFICSQKTWPKCCWQISGCWLMTSILSLLFEVWSLSRCVCVGCVLGELSYISG